MLRGCQKRIYHIKNLGQVGGAYFEEAYLVLKNNAPEFGHGSADLAAEADRIIHEACDRYCIRQKHPLLLNRGLAFALGAASSSALIGTIALLITVV